MQRAGDWIRHPPVRRPSMREPPSASPGTRMDKVRHLTSPLRRSMRSCPPVGPFRATSQCGSCDSLERALHWSCRRTHRRTSPRVSRRSGTSSSMPRQAISSLAFLDRHPNRSPAAAGPSPRPHRPDDHDGSHHRV